MCGSIEETVSKDDGLSNSVCMSAKHSSIAAISSAVDEYVQISNHCIKENDQTENRQTVSIEHDFKLGCQCRILTADLAGVKLDIVMMCRNIETKFLAAYNSRDSDSEKISELKHDTDISILVRGRNREIDELKNTLYLS
jgi:hypothetical protein